METARVMGGRIERIAEPAADFIARDDRRQQIPARGADHFRRRHGGWHDRRARMQRTVGVSVVEIEGMAERAIEQRRDRRSVAAAQAEGRRFAGPVKPEITHRAEERGRRIRVARGANDAADEIHRKALRPLGDLGRKSVIFQFSDISREDFRLIGHGNRLR